MEILGYNNRCGYVFIFYWKFKIVYICCGRSLDWKVLKKMSGIKFDSIGFEEVSIMRMVNRKRSLVLKHLPPYNNVENNKTIISSLII